jgi:hypothetical protein
MLRYLRTTVSVICGMIAIAAFVLWIRTGFSCDSVFGPFPGQRGFVVTSRQGGLSLGVSPGGPIGWGSHSLPPDTVPNLPYKGGLGFGVANTPARVAFRSPYWFYMIVPGTIAALLVNQTRWRFSLQTMFVGMTIVAVLLGVVAAATGR